ncbi:MAG: carbohydrate binding family 9 domain-containing protein [bacterium]|nr:carbohydrate binding family 9 domain-containing protein [bacterium]
MLRVVLVGWMVIVSACALGQRSYTIIRTDTPPVIDGVVNDSIWEETDVASDFTTNSPVPGNPSRYRSEFRMCYDNNALYVSGRLYDPRPDSVSYTLSQRDDFGNADWAAVNIDPFANNITAFSFAITSAGVEIDGLESADGRFDQSWNTVWRSAVSKTDYGWSFEMKIPHSAYRFPNKDIQEWNINFARSVRRDREFSHWNPIDPQVFGEITQSGKMVGIEGVTSPLRLSITPYTTGYLENSFDNALGKQTWKRRVTGGMDLKYGLNDAFTLDMTLIPDFGQTISDQQVLNLGPFEVRFNENRPFFLEGTDLFQIGGVFYSRRIGGTPYKYFDAYGDLEEGEEVTQNPNAAPLINATKVSGRTKSGLGIGVFNAIEARSNATIVDSMGNVRQFETNPLTNYNVFVLSQNTKNNGTISFVNTNVTRAGGATDANVSVVESNMFSKDGQYRLFTSAKFSSVMGQETVNGHSFGTRISKVSGTWRYNIGYWEESDTYDPNDLGFLFNNNERGYSGEVSWNDFKGSKRFFRRNFRVNWWYTELYKPQLYQNTQFGATLGGLHKKQFYTQVSAEVNPFGEVNHFESRVFGKELHFNESIFFSYFISTDYSKRVALDVRAWVKDFLNTSQYGTNLFVSPRLRASDRLDIILETSIQNLNDDYGYVSVQDDNFNGDIMIGVRDRLIVENVVSSRLVFTNRMGIDFRLRHYWQQVDYTGFRELIDEGVLEPTLYNPLNDEGVSVHNTNYNAFTLDVNFRWIFIPGSELTIFYKNNIFQTKNRLEPSYFTTFETLFEQPQINSISLRLLVFIDAIYFRRKDKK